MTVGRVDAPRRPSRNRTCGFPASGSSASLPQESAPFISEVAQHRLRERGESQKPVELFPCETLPLAPAVRPLEQLFSDSKVESADSMPVTAASTVQIMSGEFLSHGHDAFAQIPYTSSQPVIDSFEFRCESLPARDLA